MAETTRWLEFGEDVGEDRLDATIRETAVDDSEDAPPDVVRTGTIARDAFELLDTHEDVAAQDQRERSVKLTGLDPQVEDRLLSTFEESA